MIFIKISVILTGYHFLTRYQPDEKSLRRRVKKENGGNLRWGKIKRDGKWAPMKTKMSSGD